MGSDAGVARGDGLADRFAEVVEHMPAVRDLHRVGCAGAGAVDLEIFGTANFTAFVPWAAALEHLLEVGVDRIHAHDRALVERLTAGLRSIGAAVDDTESTLVFFGHPDPVRNADLHAELTTAGVDVAHRAGRLRASPHLYNATYDIDRLLDTLALQRS